MSYEIGKRCMTPDGVGTIVARERFGNGDRDYRVGVKHDVYPPRRIPGMYRDDELYYFLREVSTENLRALPAH